MKPILFAKTATTFNTNGLGRLDAISCVVTEEKNGIYELEMEIAEAADHASQIEMGSIIVAKPSQGKQIQPFRVYQITKPINGRFSVYCQHISYQLSHIPVMPFTIAASPSACNDTLQALKTNAAESCPFTFWTNITKVASYQQTVPASLRSRLGGVEGSVLDQFGGEFEWDNYTVKLWQNRGLTTPNVTLRYGKNITDLNQEENIENTITGIVPYWVSSDGETVVTLPEKTIDSQTAGNYPYKRTVPFDFSQDWEEAPTQAQLRARAQAYVSASGIGVPKVSITVSFINLSDTEDYKDIAALQVVNLCDEIGVYFEKLGISTTAKVVKTIYNVLKERYDTIEIGSLRGTLASTISDTSGALSTVANNTRNMFKSYNNEVETLIDNATEWLTSSGGYVIAVKNQDGTWKELLFMSTNDITDVHANVLRINENGLGFSSTGVAGPYTQAWTLDGKLVIGGTNVPSFTVYDSSDNIIFQVSRSGLIWNVANSSMDANGNIVAKNLSIDSTNFDLDAQGNLTCNNATATGLTANDATVNNATIKGGSLTIVQDVNGTEVEIFKVTNQGKLTVKSTSNVKIFEVDRNGLMWQQSGQYSGETKSSSMTKEGYLTAEGATFNNCKVEGGSFKSSNNQGWMELVNGNIHGGYNNQSETETIYMTYTVGTDKCLALESSDALVFASRKIYVADSPAPQTVSTGFTGSIIYRVNTADITVGGQQVRVVTSVDRKKVVNGIVTTEDDNS